MLKWNKQACQVLSLPPSPSSPQFTQFIAVKTGTAREIKHRDEILVQHVHIIAQNATLIGNVTESLFCPFESSLPKCKFKVRPDKQSYRSHSLNALNYMNTVSETRRSVALTYVRLAAAKVGLACSVCSERVGADE